MRLLRKHKYRKYMAVTKVQFSSMHVLSLLRSFHFFGVLCVHIATNVIIKHCNEKHVCVGKIKLLRILLARLWVKIVSGVMVHLFESMIVKLPEKFINQFGPFHSSVPASQPPCCYLLEKQRHANREHHHNQWNASCHTSCLIQYYFIDNSIFKEKW